MVNPKDRTWHDAGVLARLLVLLAGFGTAVAVAVLPLITDSDYGLWWQLIGYVVVTTVVGIGWTRLLQVPTGWGIGWIVVGTGAAGAAVAALDGPGRLSWLPAVLAVGVIVAFVHQMSRRDGRPRLVESVSAAVLGQAIVLFGGGWLVLDAPGGAVGPGVVGAVSCTVALLVMSLPWPRRVTLPVATVAAGLAGGAAAGQMPAVEVSAGLLVGVLAGGTSAGVDVLLGQQPSAGDRRAALAAGGAMVLAAGIAVHIGWRMAQG